MKNTREAVKNAAILAGGRSSRMGRDKALISIDGEPLVRRTARLLESLFENLVVVTARPEVASAARQPAIADLFPDCGPLGGLHVALRHFQAPFFAVACDLPYLSAAFIAHMGELWEQSPDCAALVPHSENGPEPLHAIYGPTCEAVFESALREPKIPSLRRVLEQVETRGLAPEIAHRFGARFDNWNTPDDVD